jgi:hypothetical protein
MKNYKEINQVARELVSMTCDKCHVTEDDVLEMQEWLKLDFVGGYASLFGDGERWQLDLCQKCFHELLWKYMRYVTKNIPCQ